MRDDKNKGIGNQENKEKKLPILMSMGTVLGVILGVLFNNISIGMIMGMVLGITIGAIIDGKVKK